MSLDDIRNTVEEHPRAILVIVIIVAAVIVYNQTHPTQSPAPVEITGLTIGGQSSALSASAVNNSYTDITYSLKNNDRLQHKVTVLFNLTAEGVRYVTIVTAPGHPLPSSGNAFHYDKTVDATDTLIPQRVSAWAHFSGLTGVTVNITISILVDGVSVGTAQTMTLAISA